MISSKTASLVRIAEPVWRVAASQHEQAIRTLLKPGLTSPNHVMNLGAQRHHSHVSESAPKIMALDPKHPVYNFLIEYYGLRGQKGTRRLIRWCPRPQLLMHEKSRITDANQLMSSIHDKDNDDDILLHDGILLEGASQDDLGGTLHLRAAIPHDDGIVYSPKHYYAGASNGATPFIWYKSVLQSTLNAEPILHCHGLHEWAMQYWPEGGAKEPASAKYQAHLQKRVSRKVINEAVERRGISCTHVDALRYFSPAAGPLNHHGFPLEREQQLELEQPACVHAHMDLLKIALKLEPFLDPTLLQRVLDIALKARTMDVAASPYDVTTEYNIEAIRIEDKGGRAEYRRQQVALMESADPIRRDLLRLYELVIKAGFGDDAVDKPSSERYAKAEPGGLPWRKNLLV